MKKIKILFESEMSKRQIGDNPLDFLAINKIQNGHFVSLGYLEDAELAVNRRYNIQKNDPELAQFIEKYPETRFSRDFSEVRNQEDYKKAMNMEKDSAAFIMTPTHLMKCGRYNFQWKNADSKNITYMERVLPAEWAIRKTHGFTEFEPENAFEEGDWHIKHKYNKECKDQGYKYGGPSIYPEVADKNKNAGLGWIPIGGDDADFYQHENTHNISFRQILTKSSNKEYKYFYVKENDGILEPLDYEAYKLLSKAYSSKAVEDAVEELMDQEKAFIEDMDELGRRFQERTFTWNKVLYLTGSTAGKNAETGKREYNPFIWINDKEIEKTYPWLNKQDLEDLIAESVRIAQEDLDNWKAMPEVWESKSLVNLGKVLNEVLDQDLTDNLFDEVDEILSEMYSEYDINSEADLNRAIRELTKLADGRNPRLYNEILIRLNVSNDEGDYVFDIIKDCAEAYKDQLIEDCQDIRRPHDYDDYDGNDEWN